MAIKEDWLLHLLFVAKRQAGEAATMCGNPYLLTPEPCHFHELKPCISNSKSGGHTQECSDSHPHEAGVFTCI